MGNQDPASLEQLSRAWSEAVAKRDYVGAFAAAQHGYELALRQNVRVEALMFLGLIRQLSTSLYESLSVRESKESSAACSFCFKENPIVLRGTGVAICSTCVAAARDT